MSRCSGGPLTGGELTALIRSKPLVCGGYFPVAGPTGPTGPSGLGSNSTGRFLKVDSLYGNDVSGAANPYTAPFLTISSALANASSGDTVFVYPGVYTETLTIPSGVALRGANVQTAILQKAGVSVSTTLLTMGSNCRVEDLTLNVSTASNVQLTGILYPSGTSITSKLRTCVVNVTSTYAGGNNLFGLYSPGTSASSFTTANTVRASTINVSGASSTGIVRGVYVTGSNLMTLRDTIVAATGSGNAVGIETTDAGSRVENKEGTLAGSTYDLNRTAGVIQLTGTDLVNATANGNGFSVNIEGPALQYGLIGNIQNTGGTPKYLMPGTLDNSSVDTTPFGIQSVQKLIVYGGIVQVQNTLTTGQTLSVYFCKNSIASKFYTVVLTSGQSTQILSGKSETFTTGDHFYVAFEAAGIGSGNRLLVGANTY